MLTSCLPMTVERETPTLSRRKNNDVSEGLHALSQQAHSTCETVDLFNAHGIRARLITTPRSSDWSQELAELSRCLSPTERVTFATFRSPIRQRQFLLGRQESKRLIAEQSPNAIIPWPQISIESCDLAGAGQRPAIRISQVQFPWSLSLSHSADSVLVAAALRDNVRLGVDVTTISEIRPQSLRTWLTESEHVHFDLNDPRDLAVCWSIKEAFYKAAQRGEPFRPRSVDVYRDGDRFRCHYGQRDVPESFEIHVWHLNESVAVLVHMPELPD